MPSLNIELVEETDNTWEYLHITQEGNLGFKLYLTYIQDLLTVLESNNDERIYVWEKIYVHHKRGSTIMSSSTSVIPFLVLDPSQKLSLIQYLKANYPSYLEDS